MSYYNIRNILRFLGPQLGIQRQAKHPAGQILGHGTGGARHGGQGGQCCQRGIKVTPGMDMPCLQRGFDSQQLSFVFENYRIVSVIVGQAGGQTGSPQATPCRCLRQKRVVSRANYPPQAAALRQQRQQTQAHGSMQLGHFCVDAQGLMLIPDMSEGT